MIKQYKKQLMLIGIMWCLVIAVSSCKRIDHVSSMGKYTVDTIGRIDLPEEFVALSQDSLKPDTLIAYRAADGVSHISFTRKSNKR